MKNYIKNELIKILDKLGFRILKNQTYEELINSLDSAQILRLMNLVNKEKFFEFYNCIRFSKSQLRQDLFVLAVLNFKHNGYFVEFGATNGIDLSNTNILEYKFGWDGILAEPARTWHEDLAINRRCNISHKCVWSESGSFLNFNETTDPELSTIEKYASTDGHSSSRIAKNIYDVETISLNDLLNFYNAPSVIDYLSIDTEGSEFEILKNFDFNHRRFNVITCEHNYTKSRNRIYDLLESNGYIRVLSSISLFDDWYIHSSLDCASLNFKSTIVQ